MDARTSCPAKPGTRGKSTHREARRSKSPARPHDGTLFTPRVPGVRSDIAGVTSSVSRSSVPPPGVVRAIRASAGRERSRRCGGRRAAVPPRGRSAPAFGGELCRGGPGRLRVTAAGQSGGDDERGQEATARRCRPPTPPSTRPVTADRAPPASPGAPTCGPWRHRRRHRAPVAPRPRNTARTVERAAGDAVPSRSAAPTSPRQLTVRPTKTEAMPAMRLPIAGPLGVAWTSGYGDPERGPLDEVDPHPRRRRRLAAWVPVLLIRRYGHPSVHQSGRSRCAATAGDRPAGRSDRQDDQRGDRQHMPDPREPSAVPRAARRR